MTKRSPLTCWGGKFRAVPILLQYFPSVTSKLVYVEPFLGSGVVALNYAPIVCVLNDKHDLTYHFFRIMGGCKFKRLVETYPTSEYLPIWRSRAMEYDAFETELSTVLPGKAWADEYKKRTDPVGRVIAYFILNRNNFAGASRTEFQMIYPGRPFAVFDDLIEFFTSKKRKIRIWNYDFRDVLKAVNKWTGKTRQCFIYLDPPYPSQKASQGAYGESMTESDHRDLASLLADCPHQWVMSNEEHPLVHELYDQYYAKKVKWAYSGQREHSTDGTTELLISNRPFAKREMHKKQVTTIDKYMTRES